MSEIEPTPVTMAMVLALRDKTDEPLMACRCALTDANGDMEKAAERLRVERHSWGSRQADPLRAELQNLQSATSHSDQSVLLSFKSCRAASAFLRAVSAQQEKRDAKAD